MLILAAVLALATASVSTQPGPGPSPLEPPGPANNFNQRVVDGRAVDDGCTDDDKKQLSTGMGILLQRNISMPQPRTLSITAFLPAAVQRCPVSIVQLGRETGLNFFYPVSPTPPTAAENQGSPETPTPPAPPPLPTKVHVVGGVLDILVFGGAVQQYRNIAIYDKAQRYRAELTTFVNSLTPQQYVALQSDLVQRQRFAEGINYLIIIRATFPHGRPPAPTFDRAGDQPTIATTAPDGHTVYRRSECIGTAIMGQCQGAIVPDGGYHQTCHGSMLNGMCTGPMF